MEFPSTFLNVVVTIFLSLPFLLLLSNAIKKHRNVRKLPPGPWKLPLIGNLHQLVGKLPHHILTDLSQKYGGLMHLQFGEIPVVVVSSPKIAKEMLKTNDPVFASRPDILAFKVIFYDREGMSLRPYDEYWRQMRKIFVIELLSTKKVRSFGPIRRVEGARLVESIRNSMGESVNIIEKIGMYTSAVICRAAFGGVCKDEDKFIQLVKDAFALASGFDIADMFPSYKFLHFLSGMMPKLLKIKKEIDNIVEDVINQHIHNSASGKKGNGEEDEEDLVDTLLRIKETDSLHIPITIKNIKAIILDVFAAGNETSSTSTVWAMTELMRNPQMMKKAQIEIRQAFEGKESLDEAVLQKLEYLNLIIKETLRLHPPAPLIPPRESMEDCVVDGYNIPAKTKVVVNVWAIGRDPEYWSDPDIFIPERFKNNNIDFMGNDFQFLPFGAGKRVCPGIAFGLTNVQVSLALLLYHFDWKLPEGMKPEDIDITEAFGIACPPMKDLCLIPTAHSTAATNMS